MIGSWYEVETLSAKAARGAGVPPAQALRFGTAVAVHLAQGRDPGDVRAVLDDPARIVALALKVEQGVEAASISDQPFDIAAEGHGELLASFFEALPCAVSLAGSGRGRWLVALRLDRPGQRPRPARLDMPRALAERMQNLAENLLVPETEELRLSGAGAGVTDSD